MGLICLIFLVCSLRTNICFFVIFLTLVIAFGLLTGAYLANAADFAGNASFAKKLVVVGAMPSICGSTPSIADMELGRRRFDFCDVLGGVVHLPRCPARRGRLPDPDPRRRLEHHHQGQDGEVQGVLK